MKNKIILASKNVGKLREFREILSDFEVLSMADAGFTEDIEETGKTFYENALIKARAVADKLGVPALSDDSGLTVEALGGAPGIYSARYSKEGTDAANRKKLLDTMKDKANRRAKFICTLVYYEPSGKILTATGETEGEILYREEGENGFGYDRVFYSTDLKKSMGTATAEEKNAVSHRARAIEKMKALLSGKN